MLRRTGLEFTVDYVFNTEPLRALVLGGTALNSNVDPDGSIFEQELFSGDFRPVVSIDTLAWSTTLLAIEMSFSAAITPPSNASVTAIGLVRDGNQYGKLPIASYTPHTQAVLEAATVQDLELGQTVYLEGGGEATVSGIAGDIIDLTSVTAPSGTPAFMYPAKGTFLGSYVPASALAVLASVPTSLVYTGVLDSN